MSEQATPSPEKGKYKHYAPTQILAVEPVFMRVADAAKACGLSTKFFYALIETGEGPPIVRFKGRGGTERIVGVHVPSFKRWAERKVSNALKDAGKESSDV